MVGVAGGQLVAEQSGGPAIKNQVVNDEQEFVGHAVADQHGTGERTGDQVERLADGPVPDLAGPGRPPRGLDVTQVHLGQRQVAGRLDEQARLVVDQGYAGAQRGVPADQVGQTGGEQVRPSRCRHPVADPECVRGQVGADLLGDPEVPLQPGERQRGRVRRGGRVHRGGQVRQPGRVAQGRGAVRICSASRAGVGMA